LLADDPKNIAFANERRTFMSAAALSDQNKAIARRFRDEAWGEGNLAVADEICSSDLVLHVNDPVTGDLGRGPDALRKMVTIYKAGLPDAHCIIDELIAEGDKVVIQWRGRGTHNGDLAGIAPTGKQVETTGIDIIRIVDGKVVEGWINWDTLGLLNQIGASS
jgi:predicted ester cyclase